MGPNGCVFLLFVITSKKLLLAEVVNVSLFPEGTASLQPKWQEKDLNQPGAPVLHQIANRVNGSKFLLRKCCGPGQVYHINSIEGSSNKSCVNYSASSHPSPTLIEVSQQLFFIQHDVQHRQLNTEDFEIEDGFPRNCSQDSNLLILEPDIMQADRFYPLLSGQLVVPHRFWLFDRQDYCMEDFFINNDFNKVKRIAIICISETHPFPANATDNEGKLQLDFIQPASFASTLTRDVSGKTVVRKCCDLNEAYSVANHSCISKQGYATQYFDDLLSESGDKLFFRVGLLSCPDQTQAADFELEPSGHLRIKMDDESDWIEQLLSPDDYCLDDFVVFFDDDLPETINLASFCPEKVLNSSVVVLPTDQLDPKDAFDSSLPIVKVPKCCPAGQILEDNKCKLFGSGEHAARIESNLLKSFRQLVPERINATGVIVPNSSLACGFTNNYSMEVSYAWVTPLFHLKEDNNISLSLKFDWENYWDLEVVLEPFCLEIKQYKTSGIVFNEAMVFYCTKPSHVSGHYPILLYVSVVALLTTFILYFLIPASAAAKFVTGGAGKLRQGLRRRANPTMATMLTGRNLLCHVFTLALTFICLAVTQQEFVRPGTSACTILGYTLYTSSVASFAWLTVYCFDYCWMFRGSFKVSDMMLFIPYSIFGWGVPLFTFSLAAVSQFYSSAKVFPEEYNPNMGLLRCWFSGESSAMVFFYVPICLMLALNLLFFFRLLLNPNLMNCCKRNAGPILRTNRGKETNTSRQQKDIKMAVKLFFITGVPWIFEIVAWLPNYVPSISASWRQHALYLFEIGNLLNALRGVVVFIIFVLLRPDARRQLWVWLQMCFVNKSKDASGKSPGNGKSAGSISNKSQRTFLTQMSISSDFGSSISSQSRRTNSSILERSDSEFGSAISPVDEITSL